MQSADTLRRCAALTTLCAALAGCSTLGEPLRNLKEMVSGAPAATPADAKPAAARQRRVASRFQPGSGQRRAGETGQGRGGTPGRH